MRKIEKLFFFAIFLFYEQVHFKKHEKSNEKKRGNKIFELTFVFLLYTTTVAKVRVTCPLRGHTSNKMAL